MAVPDIDTAIGIEPAVGTIAPSDALPSAEDLPYEDGIPLESNWHRLQMNLLIEVLGIAWYERTGFFVGGNMFIYYSPYKLRNEDVHGPDFFVVIGEDVDKHRSRLSWVMWHENYRLPNYILELVSPSTRHMDEVVKKQRYQDMLRTPEYVLYYPQQRRIVGWRLDARHLPAGTNRRARVAVERRIAIVAWPVGRL